MFKKSILGRVFTYLERPPEDSEILPPEPGLTITALVICIGGPFWLLYKLVMGVIEAVASVFRKIGQGMERTA